MIDEVLIREMVGTPAFLRARSYVSVGAVLSVEVTDILEGRLVVGRVRGTSVRPYKVTVQLYDEPGGVEVSDGDCTCPIGFNCKHVAAVLIALNARSRRAEPKRPVWATALRPLLEPAAEASAHAEPAVALQFELVATPGRGTTITMRPVLRGAKGRWIRTGIGWGNLAYHSARRAAPAAFRLLDEIVTLGVPNARHYYTPTAVELHTFPSARLWAVLAEAAAAGLPLVRTGVGGGPVLLAEEPACLSIDVSGDGAAWLLRPVVTSGTVVLDPAALLLLGGPAHGVAWWEPGPSGALRLARLEPPLTESVHALVTYRGGIEVPASDVPQFLREFYPSLRRRVTLTSADGSVDLPTPEPPRLAVRAAYGPGLRVAVDWFWRYPFGDATRDIPVGLLATGDHDRDTDAEAKLGLEAVAVAEALPALLGGDPYAPRLAPHADLDGADALIGLAGVLVALRDLPGFEVITGGDVPALRPATSVPVVTVGGSAVGTDWFDLEVSVSVDGETVPFGLLFAAVATDERYLVLPSGTYFPLDRPELARLREVIAEARALAEPGRATARVSRFQVSMWDDLLGLGTPSAQAAAWAESVRNIRGVSRAGDVEVPASLQATLRPYQQAGFAWLAFLYAHGLGGVLADDMGLGKTLQTIALFCHAREAEPEGPPFLVVAPTSVVGNWVAELHRFAPHLKVAAISETEARRGRPLWLEAGVADVVVTSYALLRLEYAAYADMRWAALVLDEAQAVKNHASKGFQCARALPAPVKLAVTGTPMENNLMELWAMFSIVAPGLLGDAKRFNAYYRLPVERQQDGELLEQLRRRIAPLLLRRRKEQVAAELPDKLEQVVSVDLAPKHRRIYDTLLARERQKVLGLLGDVDRHRIEILRSLTLLRQAALDPSLVDPAHAGVPATKLDVLMEQLTEVLAEGHRVLVFSQFTRFLARVKERLDGAGIAYCYLDGQTRHRAAVVRDFATGEAGVFLLSIKAGGVGLNLTEADYCILLDPWWNPATEAQAVDRAHRIGQTRTVMVYRLVSAGTIEEKVMALKEGKAKLVSSVLDGGGTSSAALSADDIRRLLD